MSAAPEVATGIGGIDEAGEVPVIEVRNLEVNYGEVEGRLLRAVSDLSFTVNAGRTLGIVGESGSGKTTVVRAILRIVDPPGAISAGEVLYNGRDLLSIREREMGTLRGNQIAMIFQDPSASLDPLQTVGAQFIETIRQHRSGSRAAARERAIEVLTAVGVRDPVAAMGSYPMEFSSGMTQRMMIGMAISCDPDVVLADEPTTGLGVVVQASILAELKAMQERLGTALILITHDIGIVSYVADDILVMYAGMCVEYGAKAAVLTRPLHPYTLGLMHSIPETDQDTDKRLEAIPGFPPDISNLPPGCPFVSRCNRAMDVCSKSKPDLVELMPGHFAACHSPVPRTEAPQYDDSFEDSQRH